MNYPVVYLCNFLYLTGVLIGGPANLISSAISADLGRQVTDYNNMDLKSALFSLFSLENFFLQDICFICMLVSVFGLNFYNICVKTNKNVQSLATIKGKKCHLLMSQDFECLNSPCSYTPLM